MQALWLTNHPAVAVVTPLSRGGALDGCSRQTIVTIERVSADRRFGDHRRPHSPMI
jgi:hypothetical protein